MPVAKGREFSLKRRVEGKSERARCVSRVVLKQRTFAQMFNGARILVAPLEWGLGHAARCVPIIKRLESAGAVPVIGADNGPLALLRQEFPHLEHVRIPGAEIKFSKGTQQTWSLARQFPSMLRSIRSEGVLLDHLRKELRLDAVISDQRFGLRNTDLPSVLITHQLFPFTPIAQGILRKLNLYHIGKFDRCWIMDEAQAPGLAGELSHGAKLPSNARYIGTHSRFQAEAPRTARKYRIVAVISGPEPQRSMLEERLSEELARIPGDHLLVRGLPSATGSEQRGKVNLVPHLNAKDLAEALRNAEHIVSRSGYTTLMDLVALGRTALLIPTPGQGEQEYLAHLHAGTGRFITQPQDDLDLGKALEQLENLSPASQKADHSLLDAAFADLASLLR